MYKNLLRKTLRDLRTSLAQTIALVLIVVLGFSSFISLISAYRDLGTSYNHIYAQLRFVVADFMFNAASPSVSYKLASFYGVSALPPRSLFFLHRSS